MNAQGYVIAAPVLPVVPVRDGGLFPVRRIYCIGRNYADHVREMGGDPTQDEPVIFDKPADSVVIKGADTPYPPMSKDLHHEIELVVAIGVAGANITRDAALSHVYGYAAGVDMTCRDLQAIAKNDGRPWDMAKGFDHSAVMGEIAPASVIGHPEAGAISLTVNGETRQASDLAKMIWDVPGIIAALSRYIALKPGDLIMTGTPDGVGAVVRGDALKGEIAGVGTVETRIV
jgi:fumarylpyruvate hydrolase